MLGQSAGLEEVMGYQHNSSSVFLVNVLYILPISRELEGSILEVSSRNKTSRSYRQRAIATFWVSPQTGSGPEHL